jgi:hypothetical protein
LHKVETDSEEEAGKSKKVEALHKILRLFLLRVKTDIDKNLLPSTFYFSVPILGENCFSLICREGNQYLHRTCRDAADAA